MEQIFPMGFTCISARNAGAGDSASVALWAADSKNSCGARGRSGRKGRKQASGGSEPEESSEGGATAEERRKRPRRAQKSGAKGGGSFESLRGAVQSDLGNGKQTSAIAKKIKAVDGNSEMSGNRRFEGQSLRESVHSKGNGKSLESEESANRLQSAKEFLIFEQKNEKLEFYKKEGKKSKFQKKISDSKAEIQNSKKQNLEAKFFDLKKIIIQTPKIQKMKKAFKPFPLKQKYFKSNAKWKKKFCELAKKANLRLLCKEQKKNVCVKNKENFKEKLTKDLEKSFQILKKGFFPEQKSFFELSIAFRRSSVSQKTLLVETPKILNPNVVCFSREKCFDLFAGHSQKTVSLAAPVQSALDFKGGKRSFDFFAAN